MSDVTFDMKNNTIEVHQRNVEPWKVTLVDTGLETMTGGRIKRVTPYIGNNTFMMTYGDGVADIDIEALIRHHKRNGKLATITATQPSGRFGSLDIGVGDMVNEFKEKPTGEAWINGGFFVLEPPIIERIAGDAILFEKEPLEGLARDNQLTAYKHRGFWQPMDTLREKNYLENLWNTGKAPWKIWG
jgi:glucose-1-phosphate cytidylyltransferase